MTTMSNTDENIHRSSNIIRLSISLPVLPVSETVSYEEQARRSTRVVS